jgi:hypothetical protein
MTDRVPTGVFAIVDEVTELLHVSEKWWVMEAKRRFYQIKKGRPYPPLFYLAINCCGVVVNTVYVSPFLKPYVLLCSQGVGWCFNTVSIEY